MQVFYCIGKIMFINVIVHKKFPLERLTCMIEESVIQIVMQLESETHFTHVLCNKKQEAASGNMDRSVIASATFSAA